MTAPSLLRRISTRVGAIAIADEGAGTPVLLWPSLFSDHRLFAHVVPLLGDGWRTIRIDGPGFGQSDAPRGAVQPDAYADAVVDLLDALGSDVLTGAVVGTLVGFLVPALHYGFGDDSGDGPRAVQLQLVPTGAGLGVVGTF